MQRIKSGATRVPWDTPGQQRLTGRIGSCWGDAVIEQRENSPRSGPTAGVSRTAHRRCGRPPASGRDENPSEDAEVGRSGSSAWDAEAVPTVSETRLRIQSGRVDGLLSL